MRVSETFSFHGDIVAVPAGSGFNGVQPVTLLSKVAASGARVYLSALQVHILNIGSDQITISLRRNGAFAVSGAVNIPGSFFDQYPSLIIGEEFAPGMFDIVATNKSGTTQPGAVAAVSADCQASWQGNLLAFDRMPSSRSLLSFLKKVLPLCVLCMLIPIMGMVDAQVQVTPGVTTARSAQPIACVNPTTFVLEACGGASTNQTVNVTQIAGSAVVTGGIAGSLSIGGTSANNTAITQNPDLIGCEVRALATNPTAATAGNIRRVLCNEEGTLYTIEGGPNRFLCVVQAATITTQCVAAPAAGLRIYVSTVSLSNQAATVQSLDIVFGTGVNCATGTGTVSHKWQFGTLATTTSPYDVSVTFQPPISTTSANALCVRPSAATAFGATITGYIAP